MFLKEGKLFSDFHIAYLWWQVFQYLRWSVNISEERWKLFNSTVDIREEDRCSFFCYFISTKKCSISLQKLLTWEIHFCSSLYPFFILTKIFHMAQSFLSNFSNQGGCAGINFPAWYQTLTWLILCSYYIPMQ